ncbi:type II toxin-antitoxin system HipA family toxin [Streptomyces cinereoruber]|uniref:type II toxin-antitoxin system HipA family toxin n=1 Tax=Streptomyces cinereoruber TaxID=67260 RepID=UPI00362C80CD
MSVRESRHAVYLYNRRVGTISQRGDYTRFSFTERYLEDANRPVLGLRFEERLQDPITSALRLPPWFSNLLPEGILRRWIADDRKVSPDREMELLAQVGHDLPGAVRVIDISEEDDEADWDFENDAPSAPQNATEHVGWRFSLAGVGLKFSMLRSGDRLTLPAFGQGGDWIVKLPDPDYPNVPHNEFAMMRLASAAGLDVPDTQLVHRDAIQGLPSHVWRGSEDWAYAVRRFDRDGSRRRIHIEDLAQVRAFYPDDKYNGNFETIAALIYRGRDVESLKEFTRRLAFNILISNGDAHLKNWSLIYRNPRIPTLAPAYDLVSTEFYRVDEKPEDLGLKFGGSRRFDTVNLGLFRRLQSRLDVELADLPETVFEVVERVNSLWRDHRDLLAVNPAMESSVGSSILERRKSLLKV